MRIATALAIAFLATPASAEFDAFALPLRPDYVLPTMRDGWNMPRPAPRVGVDNGQVNPEFRLAANRSDDGGGYDRGPGGGRDGYGGNNGVRLDRFGAALQSLGSSGNGGSAGCGCSPDRSDGHGAAAGF